MMRNVLFVIPSLEYSGPARQLTLLAAGLPRARFHVRVCVLGTLSPWAEEMRTAGVEVDGLGWKRPFDLAPFLALRRLVGDWRPDVIHAWGLPALRAVSLTRGHGVERIVASAVLPPVGKLGWIDRRLLRHVSAVVAFGSSEAERYRRLGVQDDRLVIAVPAVGLPPLKPRTQWRAGGVSPLITANHQGADAACSPKAAENKDDSASLNWVGVPAGARVVLGIGPLESHKGFRDAIWALDILHYLFADLHLVLAGTGSDRHRLEAFARATGALRRAHFTGPCPALGPLLEQAEVVWVPSHRPGGVGAALEAMAAGSPVVAARLPELAEVVVEGETGYLICPADKAALARQTRLLLDDPDRRRAFGAAGRHRASERFSVAALVERVAALYEGGKHGTKTLLTP